MNPLDELRDALRSVRRAPRLALFAVICLGVGIGAAAAMFLIVDDHRTRDLSIRVALGADPTRILAFVFWDVAIATAAGLAVGCSFLSIGARHVQQLLYGVTAGNPWAFATPVLVVAVAAAGACVPVFVRATRLDLVRVLNPG